MTTPAGSELLRTKAASWRKISIFILIAIGLVVVGMVVGRGGLFQATKPSESTVAYEITWREQSTRQKYVSGDMAACQSSELACRDAALSGQWITVSGPVVTKRDHVCATSPDEAAQLAGDGTTVTGKILETVDCAAAESADGQD